jgi:enoyl-CoA hydratase
MTQPIRYEATADAVFITIDDGRANALSTAVLDDIRGHFAAARGIDAPVVLSGRTGIFSAGFDLRTFREGAEATRHMLLAGLGLITDVLTHPSPVVAVCTGHAYPMGAFLLLAADVRLAVAGDFRIGLNEVAIGLTLPHFALALARHRLSPAALIAVQTGAMFAPDDACRLGYVDGVSPATEVGARVEAEIARIGTLDAAAYRATKARLTAPLLQALDAARSLEFGG